MHYIQSALGHGPVAKTLRSYQQSLTQYVFPALGHLRVRDIHRGHLRGLLSGMRRKGYAKNAVRLAISYAQMPWTIQSIPPIRPSASRNRKKRRGDRITQTERQQPIRPMTGHGAFAIHRRWRNCVGHAIPRSGICDEAILSRLLQKSERLTRLYRCPP